MENLQPLTKQSGVLNNYRTPVVLIQDVLNQRSYLLDGSDLEKHLLTKEMLSEIGNETVTYVIPEETSFMDFMPPFMQVPSANPSVIIQHHSQEKSYFISSQDLIKYLTPQPRTHGDGYDVSFILPHGTELIEELPEMMKGLLQTQESSK